MDRDGWITFGAILTIIGGVIGIPGLFIILAILTSPFTMGCVAVALFLSAFALGLYVIARVQELI